jgi:hypothetical protein
MPPRCNSPQQYQALGHQEPQSIPQQVAPPSPQDLDLRAAGSAPLLQPWREQLQLCFDCWNLLDAPGGTSRHCVDLSPGAKEPDANDRNRVENARPSGFFRDALRTYPGMLSFLEYLALPASLQRYANGEITHYLRDHGFAIKVPPSWRDLYTSSQKLLRQGCPPAELPERLGVTPEPWAEISAACSVRVLALPLET